MFGLIVDGSQFGGFLLLGFAFSLFNVGCLVGGLLALLVANCGGFWFRVAVLVLGCLGGCRWLPLRLWQLVVTVDLLVGALVICVWV